MKNSLRDLNNYLFEAIERVNDDGLTDDELEKEIKRAETVVKISGTILDNAKVQLQALTYADEFGCNSGGSHVIPSMIGTKA